ncbi:MAG: S8 family serine peptidase [Rhodothermales bacterium]
MSRNIAAFVGIVLIIGYTAGAAQARQPTDPPGLADRRAVLDTLHHVEAEQREAAKAWALQRGLPVSVRQSNGRRVQLVGLTGRHPTYLTSFNSGAAQTTRTQLLHPGQALGLNLTGGGLDIGIWDGGMPLKSHRELIGRVETRDDAPADDHATHVAGTLVAEGVRPDARGMAYEARLRAYDWDDDVLEMAEEAVRGVLVSNHSYGPIAGWFFGDLEDTGDQWYWLGDVTISEEEDYLFGWYDVEAAQFDRAAFAYPYLLPVVAAGNDREERGPRSGSYRVLDAQGNWQTVSVTSRPRPRDGGFDGYDSISGPAVAKNVLTVGSIRMLTPITFQMSPFSSFGPTDDGRIKPDLVGQGEGLLSPIASGIAGYGVFSGTSMSTPNVTGTLVLLQQHYFNLSGRYMRAATLKGLTLHTADDLGNPGPDYQSGWGLLNAEAAARHLSASPTNELALLESELENNETFTRLASVAEAGPLRVTLSWTDRESRRFPLRGPSSLNDPRPHLRNDLDLRVINEATGEIYFPYTLDALQPFRTAVPGDNVVDPIEQVYVPRVEAGNYTIVVSHKDALISLAPQTFSLLVSGAESAARPVAVSHLHVDESVDRVRLTWKTQFERSEGRFLIKRAPVTFSADATREVGPFSQVGEVKTGGASELPQDYVFEEAYVPAGSYLYRLFFQNADHQYLAVEADVHVPAPEQHALLANYPNPFDERTRLVLDLAQSQHVTLDVYDMLGRRVAALFDGSLTPGRYELPIDASGWAPGIYVARLITDDAIRSHRMVVAR